MKALDLSLLSLQWKAINAAREYYSCNEILHLGDGDASPTEDDHYRAVLASGALHDALEALDARLATLTAHVIPLDDLRDHDVSAECWCGPVRDEGAVIHHAADHREDHEPEQLGSPWELFFEEGR